MGFGPKGYEKLKKHRFFREINFDNLIKKDKELFKISEEENEEDRDFFKELESIKTEEEK